MLNVYVEKKSGILTHTNVSAVTVFCREGSGRGSVLYITLFSKF